MTHTHTHTLQKGGAGYKIVNALSLESLGQGVGALNHPLGDDCGI